MTMTPQEPPTPEDLLRTAGLRSTAPRRAVLQVVTDRPHVSAADIADLVEPEVKPLSRQSLHNVLDDLTGAGLLRSIQPAGSSARYETRVGDHHHVVCRGCGTVQDVDCATGSAPCLLPPTTAGFPVVDEADVTWWGLCSTCAPAAP